MYLKYRHVATCNMPVRLVVNNFFPHSVPHSFGNLRKRFKIFPLFPDDMKIPTIVFNAYFVTTLSPSNGQTMVFSSVISNIGSAYNSTTGTFTAPINGMYSFTAQLCVSNPDGRFGLVLDGNLVAGLYLYNYQDAATSSSTVPVFLKQGQKVWVRAYGCSSCFSQDSTCWNRFSGSLVHN